MAFFFSLWESLYIAISLVRQGGCLSCALLWIQLRWKKLKEFGLLGLNEFRKNWATEWFCLKLRASPHNSFCFCFPIGTVCAKQWFKYTLLRRIKQSLVLYFSCIQKAILGFSSSYKIVLLLISRIRHFLSFYKLHELGIVLRFHLRFVSVKFGKV